MRLHFYATGTCIKDELLNVAGFNFFAEIECMKNYELVGFKKLRLQVWVSLPMMPL